MVGSYARKAEDRLILHRFQRTETTIWPIERSREASKQLLQGEKRVILLQRSGISKVRCRQVPPVQVKQIQYCMPRLLKSMHYRVERLEPVGSGWVFAVLKQKSS